MSDQLTQFEDRYWSGGAQTETYRHRQALSWIRETSAPVLDIGCGDGFFLAKLHQKKIEAWGIDVSPAAIKACQSKGLHAQEADFSSGVIPDLPARTAVMLDVLEHLYDPQPILKALAMKVGEIIVTVPNFASLPARVQAVLGRVPENNTPRKGHVYWYTRKTLESVLAKNGWQVIELTGNPVWETKPLVGGLFRLLGRYWPSLFVLSFAVRVRRKVS